MPPSRANTRNVNARNANTVPLVPDQGVLNGQFQNTIQSFAQSMNNLNNNEVEGDKLREIAKVTKKARTRNYEYSQQKSGGGNHSQFRQDQNSRAPGSKSQRKEGCFGCGQSGHRVKNCYSARKGQEGNNTKAQSTSPPVPKGHPTQQAIMPPRRSNTRNANSRNTNTVPLVPDQGVSNFQQKSGGGNRSQFRQDQNSRVPGSESQGSVSENRTYPTCPKCGKNHSTECLAGKERCFGCGQSGHRVKNFSSAGKGQEGNNTKAQSTAPTVPKGHPTQKGNSSGTCGGKRQNRLYALQAPQDQEYFVDVITSMFRVLL
ncbi:uncharacterized protein LOC125816627 [Solanum verrucosum]|uniref:uncharacterized protein LOC125816627 n=1 Tax=Solanum verrucosum TaxID=315347 RepID=UPI0020D11865|nr:uncharacterized protein LOC125816627 [Solanum verrucosum]